MFHLFNTDIYHRNCIKWLVKLCKIYCVDRFIIVKPAEAHCSAWRAVCDDLLQMHRKLVCYALFCWMILLLRLYNCGSCLAHMYTYIYIYTTSMKRWRQLNKLHRIVLCIYYMQIDSFYFLFCVLYRLLIYTFSLCANKSILRLYMHVRVTIYAYMTYLQH